MTHMPTKGIPMSTTPPPPNEPVEPGPGGYPTYPGEAASTPGPGGYPTHPGTPPGGGGWQPDAVADVPQPGSIQLAVRLMWAGAAVSLVSLVVGLATLGSTKDDIRDELVKDDPNVSQSAIDAAYAVGIALVIVVGALGVLAWLWMAWKNGQGRSWARIVATVLGGLNVLFTLLAFTGANVEPVSLIFSLVNLALAVVILILMWRKESSEFYTARSRPQYG
jgi:hypothetical protein